MDLVLLLVEIVSTITGLLYVILMIRESRACWLFGNISVALLSYSCFHAGLYADMVLQWVYFVIGVVGYVQWRPIGEENEIPRVRKATASTLVFSAVVGSLFWVLSYNVLGLVPGSRLPMVDSLLFAASVIATWFQTKKYIENWMVWIPVNVTYALLYSFRGLYLYAVLSIVFAVLSYRGWKQWKSTEHVSAVIIESVGQ